MLRSPVVPPLILTALLTVLAGCAASSGTAAARERPNVIVFLVDDAGVEAFGPYGGEYPTPHLDRLAAGGARFDACHSQPLCTPSRVKLMTGRSNLRNYVRFSILDPEAWTVGHLLQSAGYATGVVGKWQLYGADSYPERWQGAGTRPEDAGFDTWCLWQVERLGSRYRSPLLEIDGELVEHGEDAYGPDVFATWATEFIAAHEREPFFLYYPMVLTHSPFEPTPASAVPAADASPAHFGDMVTHVDAVVGRVLAELEARGLTERTLVLFTSDNGAEASIVSLRNGREVRGGKRTTTDAATHVPLLVSRPGTIPAGVVCDDLVDLSDVLPTLAEAAGVTLGPERELDGRSLLPQALGRRGDPREALFCYSNPRPDQRPGWETRFARDHRFKLYGDGRLYDVAADPGEATPLPPGREADAARERLARVLAAWDGEPERIARPEGST
jgi:arylsulfatase A